MDSLIERASAFRLFGARTDTMQIYNPNNTLLYILKTDFGDFILKHLTTSKCLMLAHSSIYIGTSYFIWERLWHAMQAVGTAMRIERFGSFGRYVACAAAWNPSKLTESILIGPPTIVFTRNPKSQIELSSVQNRFAMLRSRLNNAGIRQDNGVTNAPEYANDL